MDLRRAAGIGGWGGISTSNIGFLEEFLGDIRGRGFVDVITDGRRWVPLKEVIRRPDALSA